MREAKLPRRDWIVLPLLSIATMAVVIVVLVIASHRLFRRPMATLERCLIRNDRSTGIRTIPNSTCSEQLAESDLVNYEFNSCGHRAGVECGPKAPGTFRIVAVGSSFSFGSHVQREQTFAALLPAELSRRTGRRIELYNESLIGGWPRRVTLQLDDILAAQPDMILWTFTPADLRFASLLVWSDVDPVAVPEPVKKAGFAPATWYRIKASFANNSIPDAIAAVWNYETQVFTNTRMGLLLENILYSSQERYVSSYLNGSPAEVGFLRTDLDANWRSNLHDFDEDAAAIESRAVAAGVPVVAALLPNRAQAAMIPMGTWPQGFDPFNVTRELRSIITKHGGTYVDLLQGLRTIPNPERGYLRVDGHPDARGHAMLSQLLAAALTDGSVPALASAAK